MYPASGEMDRCVIIQQPVETFTEFGDNSTAWKQVNRLWMQKRNKRGGESFTDGQKQASAVTEWWGHYIDGITEMMRIVESGKIYDINYIDDSHRHSGYIMIQTSSMPTMAQDNQRGRGQ